MDVIRLRTMTLKSRFTGGMYVDIPMRILLDMGKKAYIVAKYYQYDTINFDEEMLELLQITPELQIPKPGCKMEMYDEWKKVNSLDHLTDEERIKMISVQKSRMKRASKSKLSMMKHAKSVLAARNMKKY